MSVCVINSGRGRLLVDQDLIACLDSGQLSAFTLDASRIEPIPETIHSGSTRKSVLIRISPANPHPAGNRRNRLLTTSAASILVDLRLRV